LERRGDVWSRSLCQREIMRGKVIANTALLNTTTSADRMSLAGKGASRNSKIDARRRPSDARANPAPQCLDFLRRLAAAGVLGDAEASGDRIWKVDARGQLRLGESAKAL